MSTELNYISCDIDNFLYDFPFLDGYCNLSVLNLNIRSCRRNLYEFQVLLSSLKFKCTFIVLTEIWLDIRREWETFSIAGYKRYTIYRNAHGGGGGVLEFIFKICECNFN